MTQFARVLAIETADPDGGVALRTAADGAPREVRFAAGVRHAQSLVPTLIGLLPFAPGELDLIIVDRGPGSHTGVRIGLACARMLAWQARVPLLGVSSLAALAFEAGPALWSATPGARVLALLPCRGGHVYAQSFAGPLQPLDEPTIVEVRDSLPASFAGAHVIGRGVDVEPQLAAAADAGRVTRLPAPAYPTAAGLLATGLALAGTLSREQWPATLTPLYLAPVLAKTIAEREAGAR